MSSSLQQPQAKAKSQLQTPGKGGQHERQNQQTQQHRSNGDQEQDEPHEPAFSEEEQFQERSKAANEALESKKKARYYIRAAAGAGDSKERQRLLKKALDKEIEAESFGKLAKWLNSGALQGFAAGSIPAVSLGALTGTLVGGVTSLITGGLGAGIGYLKGPAYSVGGVAASGLQKLTGDFAEWNPDATPEQQQAFEHMCGQIEDQDMPEDDELEMFSAGEWSMGDGVKQGLNEMHDGRGKTTQSWSSYAASWVPGQRAMESVPGYSRFKGSAQDQRKVTQRKAQEGNMPQSEAAAKTKAQGPHGQPEAVNEKMRSRSQGINTAAKNIQQRQQRQRGAGSKGPPSEKAIPPPKKASSPKQNGHNDGSMTRSPQANKTGSPKVAGSKPPSISGSTKQKPATSSQQQTPKPKGKPRKLEVRSQ